MSEANRFWSGDEQDRNEPEEGHFQRFEEKLARLQKSRNRKKIVIHFVSMAASLLIICATGFYLWQTGMVSRNGLVMDEAYLEFMETERYYMGQFEEKKFKLLQYTEDRPDTRDKIMQEIREMDKELILLQSEISRFPVDERHLQALVTQYQAKIDLMGYMITVIQNQQIPRNDENENFAR